MSTNTITGLVTTALLALAPQALASDQKPMTNAEAAVAIMAYYPQAARAAGVEGMARLTCKSSQHMAFEDCRLTQESPRGFGFGQAALALSRLARENPDITFPKSYGPKTVTFSFWLNPPSIQPNTLGPSHVVLEPAFRQILDSGATARTYPKEGHGLAGRAVIMCKVTVAGDLDPCIVTEETPTGHGFGQAALRTLRLGKYRPKTVDGVPVGDGTLAVGIYFAPRR